jgi:hypothetical protein
MRANIQPALILHIGAGEDADSGELDLLTRQLRIELLELQVESVDLVTSGKAPGGAKSAEAATLGALAVVVLPAVLPRLVEFLQGWTLRAEGRTVKIKTQVADRSIEVEFSPRTSSAKEMIRLVRTLTAALEAKGAGH